ncbi:MAG: N-acetylmuramoyl-L-alanine amidase [Propionibacteriaceae bacterium]|jgi:hypothetical protein|nr:N-acetylmuramoyl-L-alanine amidase [Propionibacteriaceae bacterium]
MSGTRKGWALAASIGTVLAIVVAAFLILKPGGKTVDPAVTARRTVEILAEHGIEVSQVEGWEERQGSSAGIRLEPEGVVVHHTGSASTDPALVTEGRNDLPGPLANWFVDKSGKVFLIASGYSNNAGYGGKDAFAQIVGGQVDHELAAAATDGDWSANSHAWSVEADGRGKWPKKTRAALVKLVAAIHQAEGWKHARVIGHKELTRRKPADPADDMGKFRKDVLKTLKKWG